jgi:Methyltransferase domain
MPEAPYGMSPKGSDDSLLEICPICGGDGPYSNYLVWDGIRWDRCRGCSGGHQVPYIPEVDEPELAATQYDEAYLEQAFFERRWLFARNQAEWLARNIREGMAVLEIGPGLGLAAERFLALKPGTDYHVVEPHGFFADFITRRLGARVIVHSGDPDSALQEALDAVARKGIPTLAYLDNVLEHVARPRDFVIRLGSALPAGSRMILDVPNERALGWRCRAYKAIGAQPTAARGHINLFTKKAFRKMLRGIARRRRVYQRGIRRPEDVNCIPSGKALSLVLACLKLVPVDKLMGVANNLRVEIDFEEESVIRAGLPQVASNMSH